MLVLAALVTAAASTNVCTGNSKKLAPAQCDAWIEFYDALGGAGWECCSSLRTDPCSCQGAGPIAVGGGPRENVPVCSSDGTTVTQMCVAPQLLPPFR